MVHRLHKHNCLGKRAEIDFAEGRKRNSGNAGNNGNGTVSLPLFRCITATVYIIVKNAVNTGMFV